MSKTITLDPVTRIEGHLAIKVDVEAGKVTGAHVAGEMFRGFEQILRGRDPLDAQHITQRICGVCPVEHGIASVLAQEAAHQITPTNNGRIVRNLLQGANYIMSHITHFYLLSAVDFVDVAAITSYSGGDPALLELQVWVKTQLAAKLVAPAAPFLPRYAAKYLADANANYAALRHYLEALDVRAVAHQMGALFAGKLPHAATLVPSGVTEHVSALKITAYQNCLARLRSFIDNAYLPDVLAVAGAFPEYFAIGRSPGNFLSYGVFPESSEPNSRFLPPGVLIGGKLQPVDIEAITEDVGHSLFSSASGRKPFDGETIPAPDKAGAYSWLKAPRYAGQVVEVGPLARMLVAYHDGHNPTLRAAVDTVLKVAGRGAQDLNSVLGRHAARAIECKLIADRCATWVEQLVADQPTAAQFTPSPSGRGVGLTEAARGALGHWLEIRDHKIANYQCVVPTTWNCSPKDDHGTPGPIEQALIGTPVADPDNPIEVARVVRSFDPCLACAVH